MTLQEEMQKNRDEEIKMMKEEEVEKAKNEIRKFFLDKQSENKKESDFKVYMCWYNHHLTLGHDEKKIARIVSDKQKIEFIEFLQKKLESEGITMVPNGYCTMSWDLTVKLS